jgi:hypothetical protein
MARYIPIKDKSGYILIVSGVAFGTAGFIVTHLSFYAIGIMFILLGALSLYKNCTIESD